MSKQVEVLQDFMMEVGASFHAGRAKNCDPRLPDLTPWAHPTIDDFFATVRNLPRFRRFNEQAVRHWKEHLGGTVLVMAENWFLANQH